MNKVQESVIREVIEAAFEVGMDNVNQSLMSNNINTNKAYDEIDEGIFKLIFQEGVYFGINLTIDMYRPIVDKIKEVGGQNA